MIVSAKKVLGGKCGVCNHNEQKEVNPFVLAHGYALRCSVCNTDFIKIHKNKKNEYELTIQCYLCDDTHTYTISYDAFWNSKLFAFGCHNSGIDICYVGEEQEVADALKKLDQTLLDLTTEDGDVSPESDANIARGIHILEERAYAHKILCLCGGLNLVVTLCHSGILLACKNCGKNEFIRLESEDDVEALEKRKSILIGHWI